MSEDKLPPATEADRSQPGIENTIDYNLGYQNGREDGHNEGFAAALKLSKPIKWVKASEKKASMTTVVHIRDQHRMARLGNFYVEGNKWFLHINKTGLYDGFDVAEENLHLYEWLDESESQLSKLEPTEEEIRKAAIKCGKQLIGETGASYTSDMANALADAFKYGIQWLSSYRGNKK